jgi:hypothetical protein
MKLQNHLENKELKVSSHAIDRYIDRVENIDTHLAKEIIFSLVNENFLSMNCIDGCYPVGNKTFAIVIDSTVVTITRQKTTCQYKSVIKKEYKKPKHKGNIYDKE